MDRRRFVGAISSALAAPRAFAQQPAKVWRVGFLSASSQVPLQFIDSLRDAGYVEGRNLALDRRFAQDKVERLDGLAADLVRAKVDLIVAFATPAAQAARRATSTTPILFIGLVDPVGAGLVRNLGRPDGNATGVAIISTILGAKRLELLREIVPKLARVAILGNPDNPSNALQRSEVLAAAGKLGMQAQALEARAKDELMPAVASAAHARADALIVLDDTMLVSENKAIADAALKHRLPSMFGFKEAAEAGGMIAYGTNFAEHFRRAAVLMDKLLKGAKPADLPVEQPTTFLLTVNLRTAKALKLTVPQSILLRADKVID